jgi:hypothetical protein
MKDLDKIHHTVQHHERSHMSLPVSFFGLRSTTVSEDVMDASI